MARAGHHSSARSPWLGQVTLARAGHHSSGRSPWLGQVTMARAGHHGFVRSRATTALEGGRRRVWLRKCQTDNVKLWTSLLLPELQTVASLQKRLEEDLCSIVPHVHPTNRSVEGLTWPDLKGDLHFCSRISPLQGVEREEECVLVGGGGRVRKGRLGSYSLLTMFPIECHIIFIFNFRGFRPKFLKLGIFSHSLASRMYN